MSWAKRFPERRMSSARMAVEDSRVSESRFKPKRAALWAAVLAFAAGTCAGQPTQVHLQTQGKAVDFSTATSTRPVQTGSSLPSNCLTGEQFHLVTAPPGQNLYLCVSMNTWAAVTDADSGGADEAQELSDCRITYTSTQVLTMAACRVRTGTAIWSFPSTTFTLSSGESADTAYFYVRNGSLVAGYSLSSTTISGNGFATQSGVSAFPPDSVPLAKWNATTTPGQWDSAGTDMRVLLQRSVVEAGVGLMSSDHSGTGVRTLSLDTATTPQFTSGTAAPPASCTAGQIYVRTSTNQAYTCTSSNTWTETSPSGLADPGSNGIVKRTALQTTETALAGTDYYAPGTSIASADLPYPGTSAKGAILATACPADKFVTGYGADGAPVCGSPSGVSSSAFYSGIIDFGPVADGACARSTISATGATTGRALAFSLPSSLGGNMSGSAFVSAPDEITVCLCNFSGATLDPASATFAVRDMHSLGYYTGAATIDVEMLADGACGTGSIPVMGAAPGDNVAVGWPSTLETGLTGTAGYVSEAGTVTVRICNFSGATIDPASASFSAAITK